MVDLKPAPFPDLPCLTNVVLLPLRFQIRKDDMHIIFVIEFTGEKQDCRDIRGTPRYSITRSIFHHIVQISGMGEPGRLNSGCQ
jgi:hypothetical protein